MDQAITMLNTLEVQWYPTNDYIHVDIFSIILKFTEKLVEDHPYMMSPQQLANYLWALEVYVQCNTTSTSCPDKEHAKWKETFLSQLKD